MREEIAHYEEPPLDEDWPGTSLVAIPVPINVDRAIEEWKEYQRLCREILDDSDYATIRGIKARKRSGWAKLRRFYNVSIRVLWETREPPLAEWEPGQAFMYRFMVAGSLGERVEHGDGACESEELAGSNIAPTEHNVRAKALTRAKNRVTADLIGGGEVSAEELNGATPASQRDPVGKPKKQHWIEYGGASKKFWGWAHETLGLTDDQVHEALGVESVKEYTGSMKEAKTAIEKWLAGRIEEESE